MRRAAAECPGSAGESGCSQAKMAAIVDDMLTASSWGMVQGLILSLAYAPDGKSFAAGDSEHCVTVWAQHGQAIARHVPGINQNSHASES